MMGQTIRLLTAAAEKGVFCPSDLSALCDSDFNDIRATLRRNAPFWKRSRIQSRSLSSAKTYRLSAKQRRALRDLVVSKIEDGIEVMQQDLPPASDAHSPPSTLRAAEQSLVKIVDRSLKDEEIRRSFKSMRRNLTLFSRHVQDAESIGDELRISWLKRGYKIACDAETEEIKFLNRKFVVNREVDSIPAWDVLQNAFLQSIFKKKSSRRIIQSSGNPVLSYIKQRIAELTYHFRQPATVIVSLIIIVCAYLAGIHFPIRLFDGDEGRMIALGPNSEIRKSNQLSIQDENYEITQTAQPIQNAIKTPPYGTAATQVIGEPSLKTVMSASLNTLDKFPSVEYYGELSVGNDYPKSLDQLQIFSQVFNERQRVIKEVNSPDKTRTIRVLAGPYTSESEVKNKCDQINQIGDKSCTIVEGSTK